MMNRRKFIQGTAGGAVALQPVAAALAIEDTAGLSAVVVHDMRCPDPQAALASLGIKAVETHRIAGDTTDVWSNHLKSVWAEGKQLTAGRTWDAEFFVLKTLAREQGYKVIYEHRDNRAVTWVLG